MFKIPDFFEFNYFSLYFLKLEYTQRIYNITLASGVPLGFSRQEYWSGLPFPPPGGLPDLEIEPT